MKWNKARGTRNLCWLLGMALIASLLAACLPDPLGSATPTVTAAPTETPTPTPVWFPPTPTRTPRTQETPTPTPEMRPRLGALIFEEDFSSAAAWELGSSSRGTVALGQNELTIALVQPRAYLSSIRSEPTLGDFYAEMTASPNLCAGLDEYGLLFRLRSPGDFYRFSLSCDGQTRLDRLVGGTGGSPQPWMASASVPRGAPSSVRLGVWASGRDLRFFVNDEFQFAVSDAYHPAGLIGVFARSAAENAVTVSFSALKVYALTP